MCEGVSVLTLVFSETRCRESDRDEETVAERGWWVELVQTVHLQHRDKTEKQYILYIL